MNAECPICEEELTTTMVENGLEHYCERCGYLECEDE